MIPFWSNNPSILLNKDYIYELWPTTNMCYEQKLNAITRMIIILTILGYLLTMSSRILFIGVITIASIFALFKMKKNKLTREDIVENFESGDKIFNLMPNVNNQSVCDSIENPVTLEKVLRTEYKEGNKKNPFSNVLLTQIMDETYRKSAPPAFNPEVEIDITKNVKKSVQFMNPGIKGTNKQLFGDLWQEFQLDQSNRIFYSTPNTNVVPGDQSAYAQFLYGNMPSAKESTPEGDIQRVKDNFRYILY